MPNFLLTGAGFSRNWGCWLADEVFEYVLAEPTLTPNIRDQLWRDKNAGGNYEDSIAALRTNKAEHDLLIAILAGMFNRMRNSYSSTTGFAFEWTSDSRYQVHPFLQRFDAIFTLNQDTLLEHHYLPGFLTRRDQNRWPDWDMPGVKEYFPSYVKSPKAPKLIEGPFSLSGGQPYIKLHGSHDWTTSSGYVLITGGNKEMAIGAVPLLAAYLNYFETSVCNSNVRVMIIGYSFGDRHINSILLEAARHGAKFFIVDTAGVNVLDKRHSADRVAQRLWHDLAPHVIGGSRRPLSSTFNNDRVEHDKLSNCFAP